MRRHRSLTLERTNSPRWEDMPWSKYLEIMGPALPEETRPARVTSSHGGIHHVVSDAGAQMANVSGRLSYLAELGGAQLPVVGDFVALRGSSTPLIESVLPRRTVYRRKEAGDRYEPQAICANCDAVAIVTTVPQETEPASGNASDTALADFSVRRIERYLSTLENGVTPVIVLNKADLSPDSEAAVRFVQAQVPGVDVLAVSALHGSGVEALEARVAARQTLVVVGSSGTGKSTLVGRLIGASLRTTDVRSSDGRGRHTTTDRQMYRLPGGGLLVDTPGMRELAIWADADGRSDPVSAAFPEIAELSERCKFRDCHHQSEPGCAVLEAVHEGSIPLDRYHSFLQLRDEGALTAAERRKRQALRGKQIAKSSRAHKKQRHR